MPMDYFRRPLLAGKNLKRLSFATVVGGLRRSNGDGTSSSPYFPLAAAGQTLLIKIDGAAAVTVTLTGKAIATIIADINAALSTGFAYDAYGAIAIQTNTEGGSGSVEITGGTAASNLGFDSSVTTLFSKGGDVPSAPEGGLGNFHGVAFPGRGENLVAEATQRSMGRLASNMDVLFSDDARQDALLQQVKNGGSPFTVTSGSSLTLPAATRVFVGSPLAFASTPEELAPYFVLIDQTTKQPAVSRVTAVQKTSDSSNVLGVNTTKTTVAITSVSGGHVVECSGASFGTSTYGVEGDTVEITGATNLKPWSNNGYRWVIEKVISTTKVSLRPMSQAELAVLNPSLAEHQPVIELNGDKTGIETYGSMVVKTGFFHTDVKLIVTPALPSGSTYEIWAAQPASLRARSVSAGAQQNIAPMRAVQSRLTPEPDGIINGCAVSFDGTDVDVSSGYVRIGGKVFYIPAYSVAGTSLSWSANDLYLYFNPVTATYVTTDDAADFASSLNATSSSVSSRKLLVGHLHSEDSGSTIDVRPATRHLSNEVITLTVGEGGQFSTLTQAFSWVNTYDLVDASPANGAVPYFDIVVLSNVYVQDPGGGDTSAKLTARGVRVRGANSEVALNFGTLGSIEINPVSTSVFTFENLRFYFPVDVSEVFRLTAPTAETSIVLRNIVTGTDSPGTPSALVQSDGVGVLRDLTIEQCDLRFLKNIARTWSDTGSSISGMSGQLRLLSSVFTQVGALANTLYFTDPTVDVSTFSFGLPASISACRFESILNPTNNGTVIAIMGAGSFPISVTGCSFTGSSLYESTYSTILTHLFLDGNGIKSYFFGNDFRGLPGIVSGPGFDFHGNHVSLSAPSGATEAIYAESVVGNRINSTREAAIAVSANGMASGNKVDGFLRTGIATAYEGTVVSGNWINIDAKTLSTGSQGVLGHRACWCPTTTAQSRTTSFVSRTSALAGRPAAGESRRRRVTTRTSRTTFCRPTGPRSVRSSVWLVRMVRSLATRFADIRQGPPTTPSLFEVSSLSLGTSPRVCLLA
jgi:hypothetical protein